MSKYAPAMDATCIKNTVCICWWCTEGVLPSPTSRLTSVFSLWPFVTSDSKCTVEAHKWAYSVSGRGWWLQRAVAETRQVNQKHERITFHLRQTCGKNLCLMETNEPQMQCTHMRWHPYVICCGLPARRELETLNPFTCWGAGADKGWQSALGEQSQCISGFT